MERYTEEKLNNILKQAEINASKSVDEIKKQIMEKEIQYGETKKQFDVYKAKMEALLISQLEILKEMNQSDEH